MKYIKKIRMFNFKKFKQTEVVFNDKMNILIGDNEAGKSSILQAIDLVLSGSRNKVESIGVDNLFNIECINEFLNGRRAIENLPILAVELYLSEQGNFNLNGKNNFEKVECDGLRMIIEPDWELSEEINEVLKNEDALFPFEYYNIYFSTYAGQLFSGYKKYIRHLSIDSSTINTEYASREYIKSVYSSMVNNVDKIKHQNEYRKSKKTFKDTQLEELNSKINNFEFNIRTDTKSNLNNDLIITEESISIDNKGKGKQCFIKTEFALLKSNSKIDIILMEEPENHLSHTNMNKLINRILETEAKQIFITTHNSLIASRLNLQNAILLNSTSNVIASLSSIPNKTSKYFMKSPDKNLLEFILSPKTILVEGDAEYILMEQFIESTVNGPTASTGIHVLSVDGTSFKRYFDIAKVLEVKVVAIRDNDGDFDNNCIQLYSDYVADNIKIVSDKSNERSTFEICIYQDNKAICDELFTEGRRKLTVLDYMLKNKAEVAFELLDRKGKDLVIPEYIKEAILWIKS